MTGYLEVKGIKSPISAMTVEALADLGYEVDKSKADPFTVQYNFPKTKSPTVPRKKKNRRKLLDMERLVVKTEGSNNKKALLKEEYESNNDDDDKFGPNHKVKKVMIVDDKKKKKMKKTTEPEYESNENDEDKFGPNHASAFDDDAFTATARRRLEEQVAKGEKLFIGNDIAEIDLILLTPDSEGVEIKVKEGRAHEFESERAKFTAKLMVNTKASQ